MKIHKLSNVKIHELKKSEVSKINGGCFAYDVGWAIGFAWEFLTKDTVGMAEALVKYDTHEH